MLYVLYIRTFLHSKSENLTNSRYLFYYSYTDCFSYTTQRQRQRRLPERNSRLAGPTYDSSHLVGRKLLAGVFLATMSAVMAQKLALSKHYWYSKRDYKCLGEGNILVITPLLPRIQGWIRIYYNNILTWSNDGHSVIRYHTLAVHIHNLWYLQCTAVGKSRSTTLWPGLR